ncbi:MAG: small subunit ribosomal protein S10 [Halobacteriales archaeon]|jgi:small subunit ribosomal protein S10
MTFVTKLRLRSGDREVLDRVVTDIRSRAERKGAELKGPHSRPPDRLRVPQYRSLDTVAEYPAWDYTVYARDLEIVGHDDLARSIASRDFPSSIHVEVEVERVDPVGSSDR